MCTQSKFCNLHAHSAYSILDGMGKLEDIVSKVKRLHQPAIALTEHGNVFSAVKMYKMCKKEDVKFIYGCEFYICEDRFNKSVNAHGKKYYHLTILAKNEQGRLNINKLISLGYLEGFYSKPRIDFNLLECHKDGLIILSGCMASHLQRNLAMGNIEAAKEKVRWFKNVFEDDFYLEVQSHREETQQNLNRMIADIAKEYNIPLVATADSHYVDEEDHDIHSVFIEISQNREVGEIYKDTQIQSEEEARLFLHPGLNEDEIEEAIKNTRIIADKCDVKMPLSAPLIPHVGVPKEFKNEEEYLKHLCRIGWVKRGLHLLGKEQQEIYKKRLKYEFDAITKMGFQGYYLLVYDYVNKVTRRGVARGSGGGSLIAYLINIVDIDAIEYDLYFERFIDVGAIDLLEKGIIKPEELKIPDYDVDFDTKDREKIFKYITEKYGENKVASIGTFQTIWAKSAIKDIGRVLGYPFEEINQITKDMGEIKEIEGDEFKYELTHGSLQQYQEKYDKVFKYASKIIGLPRSFGAHPCGLVICVDDTQHYTSVMNNGSHGRVIHADMKDAELLGLVKVDILGLRTIDIIYDVLEMIGKDYEYINPKKINFKDENILNIFRKGETEGVFQMESDGMSSVLKKMSPTKLEDLIVANALYRPGSMSYIDNYINRKHGRESFEYLHNDLKQILESTYGIIVYQEQLIAIGRLAGLRNPDIIRRACGKKDAKLMSQVEPELRSGLQNRGWENCEIDKLWSDIVEFSRYSFNRSHSAAYAIIAYICAFLKYYHPLEFMTAMTNSYIGKHEEMSKCNAERVRLNTPLHSFDYKNTSPICSIKDNKIIYGTTLIKYCNEQIAKDLTNLSQKQYRNFTDFCIDVVENTSINSKQMKILITLNFFFCFGKNKKLLSIYEKCSNRYNQKHTEKTKIKRLTELYDYEMSLGNTSLDMKTQLMAENEYLGFITSLYDVDKSYVSILDIDKKYTPKLTVHQISSGKEIVLKCGKRSFFDNKSGEQVINIGDIIKIEKLTKKKRNKLVGEKWVETDEYDLHLESFTQVR